MSNLIKSDQRHPVPVEPTKEAQWLPPDDQEGEIDILDYFRVIRKRKWLILAVLVSVFALASIQTFTVTPTYQSIAKLQIDPENANILPFENVAGTSQGFLLMEAYLQTQFRILRSRTLARRVIERLNLAEEPVFSENISSGFFSIESLMGLVIPLISSTDEGVDQDQELNQSHQEQALVNRFLGSLDVTPIPSSRLVEVSYTSHQPWFAEKVVNALAEEFIDFNLQYKFDATTRATDFLQTQLLELKMEVERAEEELISYAHEHGIMNVDPTLWSDAHHHVISKLTDLNQEMTRVQVDLVSRTARYEGVKDATAADFPQHLQNEVIYALEISLFELEQKVANLSIRFGPEWPELKEASNEVAEVRRQLSREKQKAIEEEHVAHAAAVEHHKMLEGLLQEQEARTIKLNEDSIQFNILNREVTSSKLLYEGLLQRLKEAGVSAGLKSSNIHIADRGEIPRGMFRPRIFLNLIVGLMAGLLLGVAAAFVTEHVDDTLKTPDQVESFLSIPSLGLVPSIAGDGDQRTMAAKSLQSRSLLPHSDVTPRVWEAYRALRTSILLSHSGQPPRTMLVTSSFAKEGKTTTVLNTGIVLAQTGARTLLIDLDMRKPNLAKRLGLGNEQGMSSFLSGNVDLSSIISKTAIPNLSCVAAGPTPPNPAELTGSERMLAGIDLLQQYFKYIVIDSPPILSVTDPLVLSPRVDGVILVIKGGKTPKGAVQKSSSLLQDVGANILGAIVNDVDVSSSEYYYYSKAYYDYGYYESTG